MPTSKTKISVTIRTYNEEKNIRECLESVSWADDIVVVDSNSTDRTVSIAREYTGRVIMQP
jgi:glycosyltransferase involved in cell wall biosynthesis